MNDDALLPGRPRRPRIRRPISLRYHLWGLVVVTLLPMLLMGLLATWLTGREIRKTSLERLQATATTLARSVDQGLTLQLQQLRLTGSAHVLPGSTTFPQRNPDKLLPPEPNWPGILQAGAGPGTSNWISDVYRQPATGQVTVALATRLPGQEAPAVDVQASRDLIDLLPPTGDRPSGLVALVDSKGYLAARSIDPENWVGKRVPDWDTLQALGSDNGHFQAQTQEGIPIVLTFQKLQVAPGWALVVGEPLEQFQANWMNPLKGIMAGGLMALLLALLASHLVARRILRPVDRLVRRSQLIASGSDALPPPAASVISEFEQLRISLGQAESTLQQRADDARRLASELENNQKRYRRVAEAGALVFWEADARGAMQTIAGWHELTGQPDENAVGRGWEKHVYHEDLTAILRHWAEAIASGNPLDIEFRVLDKSGSWHWVRARGAQVGDLNKPQWAGVLEDVHARRQAQDNLAWLAHHDPLTGLANRAHFGHALQGALLRASPASPVGLLCLDLDRFKQVNDTLGHPVGDDLLVQIARRLDQQLRSNDLVARLGGDEFAVVVSGNGTPALCGQLAERIVKALGEPYSIGPHTVQVGVSIGIALSMDNRTDPEALHRLADQALYQAKQAGRGRFVLAGSHSH